MKIVNTLFIILSCMICFLFFITPDLIYAANGEIINLYINPLAIEVRHTKQNNITTQKHQLYLIYEESKSFKKENIQYESKMRTGIYRSIIDKTNFNNESMNIYAQLLEEIITHQRDTLYSVMIDLTKNTISSLAIVK